MIVKIFSIGVFLLVGMMLVNLIFSKMSIPKRIKRHIDYSLAVVELVIVLAYFSWVAVLVYNSNSNFMLFFLCISILLLIVPAFILIRDLIFGVFLKIQNKLPLGIMVEIDNNKGKIIKAGHFFVNIEDPQGNIKSMSYYKLKSKVITLVGDRYDLEKLNLVFKLSQNESINELSDKLKKQLYSTPWVAVSKPLKVEKLKTEGEHVLVNVGLYALDKNYEENIKGMVDKSFNL